MSAQFIKNVIPFVFIILGCICVFFPFYSHYIHPTSTLVNNLIPLIPTVAIVLACACAFFTAAFFMPRVKHFEKGNVLVNVITGDIVGTVKKTGFVWASQFPKITDFPPHCCPPNHRR